MLEFIFKDNPWLDFVYLNSPISKSTKGRLGYVPPFLGDGLQMRFRMVKAYSTFTIHIGFETACIFLLYLFMTISRYKFRLFNDRQLYFVIILSFAEAFASNSKMPIVRIFILIFAFYGIGQMFNIKIMLLLFILLVFIYFPNIIMNFMSLFDPSIAEEGGGCSASMRQSQGNIVLKLFSMNPLFGNGIGSISVMRNIGNNGQILGAESSLFQILPERGLLGFIAYIVTYISFFRYVMKYIPFRLCFFFLLSIIVMELATGQLGMIIWEGECIYV